MGIRAPLRGRAGGGMAYDSGEKGVCDLLPLVAQTSEPRGTLRRGTSVIGDQGSLFLLPKD